VIALMSDQELIITLIQGLEGIHHVLELFASPKVSSGLTTFLVPT
jgi:hypothetical protein